MPVLEQPDVAAYLLERGLVSRRSVVAGSLRIADVSSRNHNVRVSGGRPGERYLVKQGIAADSAHTLANEAALYRRLARGGAALRACVPALHGYDPERGLLILEWIEGGEDLERVVAARGRCPVGLAAALGRALAALHAVGVDGEELRRDPPWVLALHRPPLEALRYLSAASVALVMRLQADDALCGGLDTLHAGWAASALVHRDVKWANCIACPAPGGARATQVRLVDWEMAGWGDPAFDVGSAFGECLRDRAAAGALWSAYVGAAGLDAAAASALLARSVRFAGARMIQSAFEQTQERTVLERSVAASLAVARELLLEPMAAAAQRLGIAA